MAYYPKNKDIKEMFDAINYVIFKRQLPYFDKIIKQNQKQTYAYVQVFHDKTCFLHLSKYYKNKDLFVNILAHQMIHHWQTKVNKQRVNAKHHDDSFWMWQNQFQKHGLALSEIIDKYQDLDCQGCSDNILEKYYNKTIIINARRQNNKN